MFTRSHQSTHSTYSISGLISRSLLLLLTLSLLAGPVAAQNEKDLPVLELGKPIERELAGGQAHDYRLTLTAGQFLYVTVEQRGIDVVASLVAPDGKKLIEMDSPNGTQGPEPVMLVAEASGRYRLEVRSLEKNAAVGRYEVRIEELHLATGRDRSLIAAQRAVTEADLLQADGKVESLLKAIQKYKEALPDLRTAGDGKAEAVTLNSIGVVYDQLGEKQKALDYYSQALPLRRAVGDRAGEARTLNNIGFIYDSYGEKQKALDYYKQSLPLKRSVGDRKGEATTLNNISGIYNDIGEKQTALDYLNQSLLIFQSIEDQKGEGALLNNIGAVYKDLGEYPKALSYFNRSLPLLRATEYREIEASALNNIAVVYALLGEKQKALDNHNQSLALTRLIGDRSGEASTLNNIGKLYKDLGERQKALDYFTQSLTLRRTLGDRDGEATALENIGVTYDELGERQKALNHLDRALQLFQDVGDLKGEATTLSYLARYERGRGDLAAARSRIEGALDIVESLRTKVASQVLRASYLASVQDYYEFYVDLLMQLHRQQPSKGYNGEALQTSERARARSLLELLAEARADIRQGVDPVLLDRERTLQKRLNAKADRQTRLRSRTPAKEQTAAVAKEIESLAKEIESLTTELQQVEAQIKQTGPRYAALTQPQPLTLKEIQTQVLDEDTLLLEYSLGKDRSYLWAVTPTSIASFELPTRDEIETVARQVYAQLTDTKQWDTRTAAGQRELTRDKAQTPYAPNAAEKLSQMLLGPVAAQLGNKRLLVVADGALQYIPFGALPTPVRGRQVVRGSTGRTASRKSSAREYQPLVVEHEIISLPSASTLAVLRKEMRDRKPAEKTVAILADPVFESDDDRVRQAMKRAASAPPNSQSGTKSRELPLGMERAATESGLKGAELKIPRLPATRDEARQILSLVPPEQSKGSFDFDASRQTATSGDLSHYRYVHFATHGFLDSLHPELSGIVLSMVDEKGNPQDGFLRAHEVFNLKLPAELIVLSACQTGLGKEVRGEGLVSLMRGFMYAGAPRVVVSLWSVNDEATAELMARFYGGMLRDKLRPSAALRAAQVSLMKERAWKSPFYWAAFTIQGEWR